MNTDNNKIIMLLTRGFAVIGIVAVLTVGIWGAVKVAKYVPDAFSTVASALVGVTSIFVPAEPDVQISLTADTVAVNTPLTLSFIRTGSDANGVYHFAYSCHEGLTFEVPSESGAFSLAACETPIALGTQTSIRLIPVSTANRFLDVTLGISFTPEGADEARIVNTRQITVVNEDVERSNDAVTDLAGEMAGGASAVIAALSGDANNNDADKETAATDTNNRSTVTRGRTDTIFPVGNGARPENPNGRPDLAPKILAVGTVDADNNFTASSTVSIKSGEKTAVQFEVENLGTRSSGQWSFNAVLPTSPIHIFSSPTQQSLAPGDKIVYTVGFDRLKSTGKLEFVVNADPRNNINEVSEENNIRKATVNVTQ